MNNQDITFVLKARNEARRAVKALGGDFESVAKTANQVEKDTEQAAKATNALGKEAQSASDNAKKLADNTGEVAKQAGLAERAWGGVKTIIVGALGAVATGLGALALAIGPSVLLSLFPNFLPARIAAVASKLVLVAAALAGLGAFLGLAQSAREFNAALAETSTLIEGTPTQLDDLTRASRELVREFGGSKTDQIKAFYQAISAGASSIPIATEIVREANKLAIGGVTDVTTAVDILTTAVNAYGPTAINAVDASDTLFTAMKAGKTTIGELASSLGATIPIAVTTGVSFEELAAATSALTTQGIETGVAVTQVKSILQAVIKPSSEAADAASQLGLKFDVATLRSEKLAGFLEMVSEAAGGDVEVLAKLFGSVEALGGVLALTGGGADAFSDTLDAMANDAGAASEAVKKVSESLDKRLEIATSSVAETFERLGAVALNILVPVMETFATVLETVADNADILLLVMGGLVARGFLRLFAVIGPLRLAMTAFFTTLGAGGGAVAAFRAGLAAMTAGTLTAFKAAIVSAALAVKGFLTSIGLGGVVNAFTNGLAAIAARFGLVGGAASGAAIATRLFAIALRAVPFIALAAGVGGMLRMLRDAREASVRFAESLETLRGKVSGMQTALEIFEQDAGRAAGVALQKSTAGVIASYQSTIKQLQKAANRTSLQFTPNGRKAFSELNVLIGEYQAKLADVQSVNSAAKARVDAFNTALGGTGKELRELAQEQKAVGDATYNSIPDVKDLREVYGKLSGNVREALTITNELAEANGKLKFGNILAESSAFLDDSNQSADAVGRINKKLSDLRNADDMGYASEQALMLARNLVESAGGIDKLDRNTQLAVEKLTEAAVQAANVDANSREAARATAGVAETARMAAEQFKKMSEASRGGIDFRMPDNERLVDQYGRLSKLAAEQLMLQQQIAQIEARRNLTAVVQEAAKLRDTLGLTVEQQARFNKLLGDAASANTFEKASKSAAKLQEFVLKAAGGTEQLTTETLGLVMGLSEVSLANAQWAKTADEASRATGNGIRFIKTRVNEVVTASNGVAQTLTEDMASVDAALAGTTTAIVDTATKAKTSTQDIAQVADKATDAVSKVERETASALDTVRKTVGEAKDMITGIQAETDQVVMATQAAVDASTMVLTEFVVTSQELGAQSVMALADGMRSRGEEPTSVVREIAQSVDQAFAGLAGQLFNSGVNALDGFIQGLRSRQAAAIQQAKDIANSVTAATKGALKIQSPSRVFLEIGANIIDAIISALDNGADAAGSKAAEIARLIIQMFQDNIGTLVVPVEAQLTDDGMGGAGGSVLSGGGSLGTGSVLTTGNSRTNSGVLSGGSTNVVRKIGFTTSQSSKGKQYTSSFADGGYVSGRGGPRQDNLLSLLSNGEFVNNARSTAQYGPLLEAINAGKGDRALGDMYSKAYKEGESNNDAVIMKALREMNTSAQAARPVNMTQNFNFPNADADSFRRSEGQIRARTQRALQDANDRNN